MKSKTFFTSDTHFNHFNIIRLSKRPFCTWKSDTEIKPDIEYMNEELIRRWNSVVGINDCIFHLGDFAMGKREGVKPILDRLNGYKMLIKGNHDRSSQVMLEAGFDEVHTELFLPRGIVSDMSVYLHHQPVSMPRKYGDNDVDVHLCGHVHTEWKRLGSVINVGVDQWNFTPRLFEELILAKDQSFIELKSL